MHLSSDNAGRLLTVTNGRGKTRTYTYTPRHEVLSLLLPDDALETWAYNANGSVASYTNGLSETISYTYDDAGGQTGVDYPTGPDTSFGYDPVGRWNSMTDATGTSSWVMNLAGQVTSLATPQGSYTYSYSSDLGQPTTMVDSSGTWTAMYDQYHRSVGMTNPWGEQTSVSFDSAGRVDRKNLPNGMYETYTFDNRSRPTHIRTYNSADVLQETKSYVWDAASRVTSATEGGVVTAYTYDNIDQLLTEVKGAPLNYSGSYTYDANGNRLTRTVNGSTETYSYDDADKLLSITGGSNPRTYTYDAAGRTKTITAGSDVTTLSYDYDGHVASITYPASTSDSFGYNGLGARMSSSGANGNKTFRRAGIGVLSSVMSDGTKDYTPGVSSRENGVSTFQNSGLKNALDQTDSAENVTASRHYDAFGNVISSTGSWQGPFGYAGDFGYQEDPNGLKLLGHRYYDSDTGRFITSDPAGSGRNWYGYAGNNPVSRVDPAGLAIIEIWYKRVWKTNGYHSFIVVTNEETGKQKYYRGGRERTPWGRDQISYESGDYKEGSTDWIPVGDGNRKNTYLIIDDDKPASYYDRIFNYRGKQIEDSYLFYVYGPFNLTTNGGNSNSVTRELFEFAGLLDLVPKTHPVWVPWWQSQLPVTRFGKIVD